MASDIVDAEAVAPDGIMQLGLGFWGAKTLLSAVELGLFSALARGPAGAEVLQQRLGLHPRGTRDFLDALPVSDVERAPADVVVDRIRERFGGGS